MLTDVLEGRLLDLKRIAKSVREVEAEGKYRPTVLILSEDNFNGLVNALALHGQPTHLSALKKLGIKRVVWGHGMSDGEFIVSSGKGISKSIETLVVK